MFARKSLFLVQIFGLSTILCGMTPEASEAAARGHRRGAKLIERSHLTETIVHDVYSLRIGSGGFDTIRVHRVTESVGHRGPDASSPRGRRHAHQKPRKSIFLIHGATGSFASGFLAGTLPSAETEDQSLAVYLAKHEIDVWGIDLAWSLVPLGTEDLAFLADWGLQRQIQEINAGLDFARWKRGGNEPMFLLGYSLGGALGYAVLNEDTRRPRSRRRVDGWIAMDSAFKNGAPGAVANACVAAGTNDDLLAGGVFRETTAQFARTFSTLALTDPNGPSPFAPALTNRQFGLVVAALPQPDPPPAADNASYHFFAGIFDPTTGFPIDLAHVTPEFAFEWARALDGGTPTRLLSEVNHVNCGDIDLPFDDFLGAVDVPVLYLGADGGFGDAGVFTTSLLGSTDVSVAIVDLVPGDRVSDYGHLDIGTATNARFLVWDTMVGWIESHDGSD